MNWLSPEILIALATLTFLEIVLGVDNIIFIASLSGRLPESMRERARKVGLAGAFVTRLGLLAMLSWIVLSMGLLVGSQLLEVHEDWQAADKAYFNMEAERANAAA